MLSPRPEDLQIPGIAHVSVVRSQAPAALAGENTLGKFLSILTMAMGKAPGGGWFVSLSLAESDSKAKIVAELCPFLREQARATGRSLVYLTPNAESMAHVRRELAGLGVSQEIRFATWDQMDAERAARSWVVGDTDCHRPVTDFEERVALQKAVEDLGKHEKAMGILLDQAGQASAVTIPAAPGTRTDKAFCPECGTQVDLGDAFCQECGTRLPAEIAGA
jgi:hypothetical protein